jgi:hypothetical protein
MEDIWGGTGKATLITRDQYERQLYEEAKKTIYISKPYIQIIKEIIEKDNIEEK